MRLIWILVPLLFQASNLCSTFAAEPSSGKRPIQALLVTGGCCHDYDRQKLILTRGISARADVHWTVVQQGGKTTDTPIPLYRDPNWAEGFDIVVHNECFSNVKDKQFVDRVLKPHQEGTPAILIHCAMHCYRVGDDRWFKFVGLQSPGHGPHYSFTAENLKPDHPIMAGFGESFIAPKGELYHAAKVLDTATPLAAAKRQSDSVPQVCIWTNDYRGTRVFGTTIGHYNETMAEPKYLDLLTKGLLWAVGKDPESDFHPADEKTNQEIKALIDLKIAKSSSEYLPQNCCGDGNLAYQKPVTAKSQQSGNFTKHLTDGLLNTRWCANGSQTDEWVTVDLQQPQTIKSIRLHWEKRTGSTYRYRVEASPDNQTWTTIVDQSANQEPGGIRAHQVQSQNVRYIRITFLGSSNGVWGSIWELEVSAGDLPDLGDLAPVEAPVTSTFVDVKTPPGFQVTPFGIPPEVNYPVCLAAAATGEVFVGVDEQGSLGKESGRGKILRCMDTDGDGVADRINEFAKVDHPRGLIYDAGSLWVLHPPQLSVLRDLDLDGIADESEVLIEGISTKEVAKRGADHTTNGIRMGIDGWIYIAVGDYGFNRAVAKDGTTLSRRGGGVVRIRPDGTEMEIYAWGLRNIMDVAIDPFMNLFTRGNTNDGGGWDVRLSHILQTADFGYPSLYKNFSDEIMPPLADYGGGSGCGAMYFQDQRWPQGFNDLLLTCDWGRSEVFRHKLSPHGPTFDAQQDTFLKLPRPTDIDVDASGRMYVSSWKNGKFAYGGPNVGFVAQITPTHFVPHPTADVSAMSDRELVPALTGPSAAGRLSVQREMLRRARAGDLEFVNGLEEIAHNEGYPMTGRIAAIFTLGQLSSPAVSLSLRKMTQIRELRPHAIRALSDRGGKVGPADLAIIKEALGDTDPRTVAAALVAIGRMSSSEDERSKFSPELLKLASATSSATGGGDPWRLPHPKRVIPHLARRTLMHLNAIDACLAAIEGPHRDGALSALKLMHDARTIDGLFQILSTSRDPKLRRELWTTLIRLYHREGNFTEESRGWWGTRPDTTGPYYDRQKWDQSDRIGAAIKVAVAEASKQDAELEQHIREQLKRHVVNLDGIGAAEIAAMNQPEKAIVVPKVDPDNPNQIANLPLEQVFARAEKTGGKPHAGKQLFQSQSCVNCHTVANGQQPKGPHLVDIGKRYNKRELIESIVAPSKKIAQGFDTWAFLMVDGRIETGFIVNESAETVTLRQNNGLPRELLQDDIEQRIKREESMMPKGIVDNLTPEQISDLVAFLQTLK